MNDRELVSRILARDRSALVYFWRRYERELSAHIHSKIANHCDAEEVLQDTLYAFLEALREYEGRASIRTFLYAIVSRKIVDHYRKKKVKQIIFSELPGLEAIVSPLLTPEEAFDSRVLKEKVAVTLNTIMPKYKSLLLSKYGDDMTLGDIARKLSVTLKSAESALFRAKKAFVKAFVSM